MSVERLILISKTKENVSCFRDSFTFVIIMSYAAIEMNTLLYEQTDSLKVRQNFVLKR